MGVWEPMSSGNTRVWATTLFTTSDTTGVAANQVKGAITTFWMMDSNFTVAPVFASTSRFYYVDN